MVKMSGIWVSRDPSDHTQYFLTRKTNEYLKSKRSKDLSEGNSRARCPLIVQDRAKSLNENVIVIQC